MMARSAYWLISRSVGVTLILAFALCLVLFGRHGASLSVRAQQIDRTAAIRQFLNARSQGDVDGALAAFTDTAVFRPNPCAEGSPSEGTVALRSLFQQQVSGHSSATITDIQASGSIVTGRFEASSDNFRAAGLSRVVEFFTAQVPSDTISRWSVLADLTDAQTAQFCMVPQAPAG